MIESQKWGEYKGEPVYRYTLSNEAGASCGLTNYGGRITSLRVPDGHGEAVETVLGYSDLGSYLEDEHFLGAIVGRYANRIEAGEFSLEEEEFSLTCNDGPHHLHGGEVGFDKRLWRAEPVKLAEGPGVRLRYLSRDGEEGYPGNLSVRVTYLLTEANEFEMRFEASADRPTIVNITNHNYYNLSPDDDTVLDHELFVDSDRFIPIDAEGIPTGESRSVEETPFDFREPKTIEDGISSGDDQIRFPGGYDHSFVLNEGPGPDAGLRSPASGVSLTLKTNQPGLQVYSANYLKGRAAGSGNSPRGPQSAVCLEPGNFPNAPNEPRFPNPVVRPGQPYEATTRLGFRAEPSRDSGQHDG